MKNPFMLIALLVAALFTVSAASAMDGYTTSVDVYLDVDAYDTNDLKFDFSSAINTALDDQDACFHRRDFIFNCGFYNELTNDYPYDEYFVCSASNNVPGWPKNPGRDPFTITETGWYTFEHVFYDDGLGVLAVDLNIYDSDGVLLHTWTLSDPADIIGTTVGGNRYGWFLNVDPALGALAIDNAQRCDHNGCSFEQGFEVDTDGWFDLGGTITRVATNGVVSADGDYHAETDGAFTRWGGYSCEFPSFERSAEITSPEAGEEVYGLVDFSATLNDRDGDDTVAWAVREGTCDVNDAATVAGNVAGFNDAYDWDGETFHSQLDVSSWNYGMHCFIFNPTESQGDEPIRETREFYVIDPDPDNDGVFVDADYCPGTEAESTEELGVNRWVWDGQDWVTEAPKGKGKGPAFDVSMEDTQGCSCAQILVELKAATGGEFEGHDKFGCSKSVIEAWTDGRYYLESFEVDSNAPDGASSLMSLIDGQEYVLAASNTWENANNVADAEYTSEDGWVTVEDGRAGEEGRNDLQVDDLFVDWGSYSADHAYELVYVGTGAPVSLRVFDGIAATNTQNLAWYADNVGILSVDVYAKLW